MIKRRPHTTSERVLAERPRLGPELDARRIDEGEVPRVVRGISSYEVDLSQSGCLDGVLDACESLFQRSHQSLVVRRRLVRLEE